MTTPDPSVTGPVVDVHAHTVAPAVLGLVQGEAGLAEEQEFLARTFGAESIAENERVAATLVPLLNDLPSRLEVMDAAGVDVQAVSVSPGQYHYWADPPLAAELSRAVNEHVAALVAARPDRLVGLASVALQHPEQAADELAHAMGALGLRGVEISTNVAGRELSDPGLEPFWAAAEELGAFVFVHPWGCSLGERLDRWYLANVVGQPVETTVALSHLVFGRVLDRHPGLVVCGAHGGGYLPYYLGRADHAYEVRPESRTSDRPPSTYLRQLYFDSLVYRGDTLSQLVDAAGPDHVLLGTDYPFDMGVTDPLRRLDDAPGRSDEDRRRIAGANAAALLRITNKEDER